MMLFLRLWCFLFGHKPAHVTVNFAREDGSQFQEQRDLIVVQPAPGANPVVLNICPRCGEAVRHVAREKHYAQILAMRAKEEAAKKSEPAPIEKPLPPSPIPFDRAVKKLKKKNAEKTAPAATPAPATPDTSKKS